MAKTKKYPVQLNMYVTAEFKAEIERISEKRDMSQQKVMRMLMEVGLDCHKDLERLGIIGTMDFAYYVKEAVKAKLATSGKKQMNLI